MIRFSRDDLTQNAFLGGRLQLWQPRRGYRAGIDPVLLAASVPATPGQKILDLGCGVGTAGLCLQARVPGVAVTGVELQQNYAALAERNAVEAGANLRVVVGHATDLSQVLAAEQFDHVLTNPPFFDPAKRTPAKDKGREIGLAGDMSLTAWIEAASRRLLPKGYLHVIYRAERLPELLAACASRLGSVEVLPLSARVGRASDLILLRARKGGRAAFRLHAPLVLHEGSTHLRDGDDYCAEIGGILRDGQALSWPQSRPSGRPPPIHH